MTERAPDDAVSDAALLERARAGDEGAFATLLQRHAESMRQFAERRLPRSLRRRVSVADVLQETRLVALRRCGDFEDRGGNSLRNWLLGIVAHKVREAVRAHAGAERRSVRRETPRGARPDTQALPGRLTTPSAAAVGAEVADLAERALAGLPEDYREILVLTRREHLDLDEAARRMGRSREATRKLLGRAVARFAAAFEALCEGGP